MSWPSATMNSAIGSSGSSVAPRYRPGSDHSPSTVDTWSSSPAVTAISVVKRNDTRDADASAAFCRTSIAVSPPIPVGASDAADAVAVAIAISAAERGSPPIPALPPFDPEPQATAPMIAAAASKGRSRIAE